MKPIEDRSIYGAWLQAAEHLKSCKDHNDYNVILDIQSPLSFEEGDDIARQTVDSFLRKHGKQPLDTVAGTIFPLGLYQRFGVEGVYTKYPEVVYPKIRKKGNDWGRYAYRLVRIEDSTKNKSILRDAEQKPINPLKTIIAKLSNYKNNPKRAIYEVGLIDPVQDIPIYRAVHDKEFIMSGPCLSHLSFKITNEKTLSLTAFYRNHYYVERALGNLLGLAWLLDFASKESGIPVGNLTCISSMAKLEPGKWTSSELAALIESCQPSLRGSGSVSPIVWTKSN